jgi:hypothetical protein
MVLACSALNNLGQEVTGHSAGFMPNPVDAAPGSWWSEMLGRLRQLVDYVLRGVPASW